MKTLMKLTIAICLLSFSVQAQTNTLVSTTITADMAKNATSMRVVATTGMNAPTAGVPASMLYIIDQGEAVGQLVQVQSISGLTVRFTPRGSGAIGNAHLSGAVVLIATTPDWFYTSNPSGPCAGSNVNIANITTPYLNTNTGQQWLCSSVTSTWVAGGGGAGRCCAGRGFRGGGLLRCPIACDGRLPGHLPHPLDSHRGRRRRNRRTHDG